MFSMSVKSASFPKKLWWKPFTSLVKQIKVAFHLNWKNRVWSKNEKLFFKAIICTMTLGNKGANAKFSKFEIFASPYDDNRTIAAKQ